jgi:hypothetical protein
MKGKIKLLGHIGLVLFVVSALMLMLVPAVPVAAAAVTSVWLEFPGAMNTTYDSVYDTLAPTATYNQTSTQSNMIVHFTATTALKANIDTITIYFPDGSTELSGSGNSAGTFTVTAATLTRSIAICVDPDGAGSTYSYYKINASATAAGYRLKLTTPIDIAAGAKPYVFIGGDACNIETSSVESSNYKIKMQTSKDTTLVLSPTFALGTSGYAPIIYRASTDSYVASPSIAGSGATFTFTFDATHALTAESSTITVIFPAGTSVPSSIDAAQIECQYYNASFTGTETGQGYQACSGTVTVNSDARMVTLTAPVSSSADAYGYAVRFKTGAGITLPQVITGTYETSTEYDYVDYYIYTSADRLMDTGTGGDALTAGNFKVACGAAYQLGFNNDAYVQGYTPASYSDDCAIINGFGGKLYVELQDQYGNRLVTGTGITSTVTYSCTAGSVYTTASTANSTTSAALSAGIDDLYFRATSAGTHTITASSGSYVSGTWQVTVAPAVELYDANLQLVNTFAPLTTNTTPTLKGGYYINAAVSAAMAGDTIRLGNGIYDITDDVITVNKAVTIEKVSGTTPILRATGTPAQGTSRVDVTMGATFDGLTFRGLRWTTDYIGGSFFRVVPASATFFTIKNCTFEDAKSSRGAIFWEGGSTAVTSCTISNNTFRNLIADYVNCTAVLWFEPSANVSGLTISNNTFLNNAMMLINLCASSSSTITGVTISGNTISSNRSNEGGIDLYSWAGVLGSATAPIKIINNEISGCMDQAIRLQEGSGTTGSFSAIFPGVRIKRNYIHDNAEEAIKLITAGTTTSTTALIAGVLEIMYNDIVGNAQVSGIYAIQNSLLEATATAQVTAQYNWFGDASGPTVTANVGGTGNTVGTYVVYSPWLYKSRTDVVADNVAYGAARMNLVSGWNTLSTPVKLIEAADAIDELIPSGMTIAYYYDATGWHQIIGTYVLNPCNAVYVKMSTTASPLLKFDAGAFSTPSKALSAGWNLISLASLSSSGKRMDYAVASVALTAAGLPGYSQVVSPSMNASQTDIYGTSGSGWASSYGETSTAGTMYAGLGYWVYMQNAATLAGFEITPIAPDLD